MNSEHDRMAPKVHPLDRAVEAGDPYALHATPVPGDPEVMLRCVAQEYAWMGWDLDHLVDLFHAPGYPALNDLLSLYGETGLRERLARVLRETGVFQFEAVVVEGPEEDEEPDLIELGIPADWRTVTESE